MNSFCVQRVSTYEGFHCNECNKKITIIFIVVVTWGIFLIVRVAGLSCAATVMSIFDIVDIRHDFRKAVSIVNS